MNRLIKNDNAIIQEDSWRNLRNLTKARIALGNVGGSLPLREVLDFKLAHALVKDAIYSTLNTEKLSQQLSVFGLPVFVLQSQAETRQQYLKRPDLGRRIDKKSADILKQTPKQFDMVFVVADGLSAEAVNTHVPEIFKMILPVLFSQYRIAIALVKQGRVAVGDEIGELLGAHFTAVFIGERPGLSSPESMGIYTTYGPQIGLTDERRNCISNIHSDGLSYSDASHILAYLVKQSFLTKNSGIDIKTETDKLIVEETVVLGK